MEQEKDLFGVEIRKHCECKWCTETSPGIRKVYDKIGEDEDLRKFFDSFVDEYMMFECDAEYYKCICDGEWQRDREQFDEFIKFLTKKRDERFPLDKDQNGVIFAVSNSWYIEDVKKRTMPYTKRQGNYKRIRAGTP